jgi:molecular chaperone GrpE
MSDRSPEEEPVIITDKRKIDRQKSGAAADPADAGSAAAAAAPASEPGQVPMVEAALLAERTADLQRVQAEYANYRKRAERDRLAAGELAISRALTEFLPVLDNIDRAREHGDLTGGLKAVADQLETIFGKLGLVAFGEVGDRFDPAIHEAVMHDESQDVDEPTCTTVMRPGYKHNDRLLRPAMVGVSDPAGEPPAEDPTTESD